MVKSNWLLFCSRKPDAIILKRGIQLVVLGFFILACSVAYERQVNEKFNFNFINMSKVMGLNGQEIENEELVKFAPVPETPFTVARVIEDEKEAPDFYVLFGNYRFSEALATEEEAIESAKEITWDKLMAMMTIAIKEQDKWLNGVKDLDDE